MCTNYNELAEEWRSTEYSATVDKSDHAMPSGWLVEKLLDPLDYDTVDLDHLLSRFLKITISFH